MVVRVLGGQGQHRQLLVQVALVLGEQGRHRQLLVLGEQGVQEEQGQHHRLLVLVVRVLGEQGQHHPWKEVREQGEQGHHPWSSCYSWRMKMMKLVPQQWPHRRWFVVAPPRLSW